MPVYLDYNATTPIDDSVYSIICNTLAKSWGNPSSSYSYGKEAQDIIENSRAKVADMIKCLSDEIIFTSGGTESNNMVIHTAVEDFLHNREINGSHDNANDKPHIITTNIEHDSVKLPLETLLKSGKIDVTFVPVSKITGCVRVSEVINAIRPNTCLISVMLANNETGVIQPLKMLSSSLKKFELNTSQKIFLHTDAAQALGKINVDIQDLGVDYLTIVGHKFYGPRIGALYFRRGVPLYPMFYGGGQEKNYRPGTENTCMVAGLGKAAELVSLNVNTYEETMAKLCTYLEKSLQDEFSDKVVFNVSSDVVRLPNTLSVAFNYNNLTGHDILREATDICASTGAACHSSGKSSGVLLASGVPKNLVSKTLRLSIGRETSIHDIDKAILSLKTAIKKLCE